MLKYITHWLLLLSFLPVIVYAHSPWGQYQVYREKHMLILSTRDDEKSYPFSKELVACLQEQLPIASARPARAINLERAFNLLRTAQFEFAILPKAHIALLRANEGDYQAPEPLKLSTMLSFAEDMQLVVRSDFPDELVATVVEHLLPCQQAFTYPVDLSANVLLDEQLHSGAQQVIRHYLLTQAKKSS